VVKTNTLSPLVLRRRRTRAKEIIARLKSLFPDAGIVLNYGSNWELLVAVILSAQCTDAMVNKVTAKLFRKYKTVDDYVRADRQVFERDIRPTGFYRAKAKSILAAAKVIKEQHGGKVPRTMKELVALPGVGRKTANVVLGNAYGVMEGIAVDTHVRRLARRFGLTDHTDPENIERDLMDIVPRKDWFLLTYLLIAYGRAYCTARPHDHDACPLREFDAT
jgi:endonuclease III